MSSSVSDPMRGSWRQALGARMRALRAFSLPVSVLPVLAATAAVRPPSQWCWGVLIAAAVAAGLLHLVGNLLNDYFDFRSGVDRKIEGDEGRPGRLLVRGELKPREVLIEALICLALALIAVIYLVAVCGPMVLALGGIAAFGLYAYTGPPFKLKYRALGEIVIFLVFGPALMLGAAYAQTGQWHWPVFWLSIPVGFATTAILVANNIRDDAEDGDAGIVTLVGAVGVAKVRVLYVALIVGSVLGLAVLAVLLPELPIIVVAAPVLLILVLKPLISVCRGRRLPDIDAQTARFETAVLVFLIVVLIVTGVQQSPSLPQ